MITFFKILFFLFYIVLKTRAATTGCDPLRQWDCDNGECIASIDLCDGHINCADGSDETVENCVHLPCPSYAYRCAYGACVAGTNRCNGRSDCVDGSDETNFQCSDDVQAIKFQLQGNCSSPLLMQCKSGECIHMEQRCDGAPNCRDASDESVEYCSYIYCPKYAFRCGYGGCVSGNAQCDGLDDCYDGSDEAAQLCGRPRDRVAIMPVATTPQTLHPVVSTPQTLYPVSTTPQTLHPVATTPENEVGSQQGCLIPPNREKLLVEYEQTGATVSPGITVEALAALRFSCQKPWHLQGGAQNLCLGKDQWLYELPRCSNYCPEGVIKNGISTVAKCKYNNVPIPCDSYMLTGTTATISCARGYELPKNNTLPRVLTCDQDNKWDSAKFKCTPRCGIQPRGRAAATHKPWEVSIFKRSFEPNFERQCGGTIVSPKIVLTAATCFADAISHLDSIYYNVLEGHRIQSYSHDVPPEDRAYNISEIILSDSYSTGEQTSASSLAILVLVNYFQLSVTAKPICLEFQLAPTGALQTYTIPANKGQREPVHIGAARELQNDAGASLLFAVVSQKFGNGTVMLLNVNYFKHFINRQLTLHDYLL